MTEQPLASQLAAGSRALASPTTSPLAKPLGTGAVSPKPLCCLWPPPISPPKPSRCSQDAHKMLTRCSQLTALGARGSHGRLAMMRWGQGAGIQPVWMLTFPSAHAFQHTRPAV
ncbi:hypothetical protein CDD82_3368 [Ophiocordyceps australis]|uniref:Uncharacterized protein n=1 Tax=Ophiocordyceps australis TaxID=1399860 RepID=A0A2C5Z9T1_9HYPO|nr:hypothetical protein CDD82_3368 [Ophiocordyceps australis]